MGKYFTWFGTVSTPQEPKRELVLMANALADAFRKSERWYEPGISQIMHRSAAKRALELAKEWQKRIPCTWTQHAFDETACAYIINDQAVFTTSADYVRRLDIAVVCWPLVLEGPAQSLEP